EQLQDPNEHMNRYFEGVGLPCLFEHYDPDFLYDITDPVKPLLWRVLQSMDYMAFKKSVADLTKIPQIYYISKKHNDYFDFIKHLANDNESLWKDVLQKRIKKAENSKIFLELFKAWPGAEMEYSEINAMYNKAHRRSQINNYQKIRHDFYHIMDHFLKTKGDDPMVEKVTGLVLHVLKKTNN
ncbi:MAG: hypothetical protein FWF96_06700, partial [Kiritimatiellaeota bacterium]|nr:hypothetical protein [Kiritimatiellota bacterium]